MRVLHLSKSLIYGGAARAACRIHDSLKLTSILSETYTHDHNPSPVFPRLSVTDKLYTRLCEHASKYFLAHCSTSSFSPRSISLLPTRTLSQIKYFNADIYHLHWINHGLLSLFDIASIKSPIVWTFHDHWPISGTEHCPLHAHWTTGYHEHPLVTTLLNLDIDRLLWRVKSRLCRRHIHVVCPSSWLASKVSRSPLADYWSINTIPNPLDTSLWKPSDVLSSRKLFNLPIRKKILLFGSFFENSSFHKGADILQASLTYLAQGTDVTGLHIVTLGSGDFPLDLPLCYSRTNIPVLTDDYSLISLLSCVDALAVPSRSESFCQMASEAHACGTPVVAFRHTGVQEIILHRKTGYLAEAFSPVDFAKGIGFVLSESASALSSSARLRAVNHFSYERVASQYDDLYRKAFTESLS